MFFTIQYLSIESTILKASDYYRLYNKVYMPVARQYNISYIGCQQLTNAILKHGITQGSGITGTCDLAMVPCPLVNCKV